jgi:hypothetical protein
MSAGFRRRIIADLQSAVTRAGEDEDLGREVLRKELVYRIARYHKALDTVTRIAPVDVALWLRQDTEFAEAEWVRAVDLLPDRPPAESPNVEGADAVPTRCCRGPAQAQGYIPRLDKEGRDRWWNLQKRIGKVSRIMPVLAEYWADGHRCIAEIGTLVRQEIGQEVTELLVEYFSELAELGLVEVR